MRKSTQLRGPRGLRVFADALKPMQSNPIMDESFSTQDARAVVLSSEVPVKTRRASPMNWLLQ